MKDADILIAALSSEQFIKRYWMQRPGVIKAGQYFLESSGLLPPEDLLWKHASELPSSIDFIYKGSFHKVPAIAESMSSKENIAEAARQVVVVAHEICETNPFYYHVAHGLAERFFSGHQVGAFIALNRLDGAMKHKDRLHTFVFQHIGESKWRIYGRKGGNLIGKFVLVPGDILYVPAGYYHEVERLTEQTCHISMGFMYRNPNDAAWALRYSPWLIRIVSPEMRTMKRQALRRYLQKKYHINQTHTKITQP